MSLRQRVMCQIDAVVDFLVPVSIAAFVMAFVVFCELVAEAALEGRIR